MRVSLTTLLVVSCCIGAGTARATLIGLEALPPQVNVPKVKVKYKVKHKADTGIFEAKTKGKKGKKMNYSPDGVNWFKGTGSFSLIMQINSDDGTLISGSMDFTTKKGKKGESGFPENARITAELEEFGYDLGAGMFDFHFINTVAVGDSINPFAAGGGVLDVTLVMGGHGKHWAHGKHWPQDFSKNWSGKGTAEIGIPEPSTIALLMLGAIGLIRRRRRSR